MSKEGYNRSGRSFDNRELIDFLNNEDRKRSFRRSRAKQLYEKYNRTELIAFLNEADKQRYYEENCYCADVDEDYLEDEYEYDREDEYNDDDDENEEFEDDYDYELEEELSDYSLWGEGYKYGETGSYSEDAFDDDYDAPDLADYGYYYSDDEFDYDSYS